MTWYEDFYAGVDAMDITVVERLCTADTTVRFANHSPAEGTEQVRAALEHMWSTIAGLRHTITEVIEVGECCVIEAVVEYTRLDGTVVSIPAATAIERRGGLIAAQRIYIDLAPLDAPSAHGGAAEQQEKRAEPFNTRVAG
jgi:ketosteroid isomerase-like protein